MHGSSASGFAGHLAPFGLPLMPNVRRFCLRSIVAAQLALTFGLADAQPFAHGDACFVRAEPSPLAQGSTVRPAASESRLGIRRKTGRLFDVELSVVGPGGAVCSVSGVARLREDGVLALPVRPERGAIAKPPATPCLVYLRAMPEAVEVTTAEAACQAQSLCAGQVQLPGQRFEIATRVPSSSRNQCFAQPAPAMLHVKVTPNLHGASVRQTASCMPSCVSSNPAPCLPTSRSTDPLSASAKPPS